MGGRGPWRWAGVGPPPPLPALRTGLSWAQDAALGRPPDAKVLCRVHCGNRSNQFCSQVLLQDPWLWDLRAHSSSVGGPAWGGQGQGWRATRGTQQAGAQHSQEHRGKRWLSRPPGVGRGLPPSLGPARPRALGTGGHGGGALGSDFAGAHVSSPCDQNEAARPGA